MNRKHQIRKQIRELENELIRLEVKSNKKKTAFSGHVNLWRDADRFLVDALPDLVIIMDKQGHIIDVFESADVELYDDVAKLLGANVHDILPAPVADMTTKKIKLVLRKKKKQIYQYDLDIAGEKNYYQARMVPYGEDHVLAVISKITDKLIAQNKAKKKAGFLYQVMKNSPVGILQISKSGDVLFASEAVRTLRNQIQKIKENYAPGEGCKRVIVDKYGSLNAVFEAVSNSPENYLRFTVFLKGNRNQTLSLVYTVLTEKDPLDKEEQLFIYVENVTEYYQTNKRLEESREHLKEIQKLSRIAYWQYDPETRIYSGFERLLDYLNVDDIKPQLTREELFAYLHPDDVDKMKYLDDNMMARKHNLVEQFRLVVNGFVYWMEIRSNTRHTENRKTPLIYGSIQDITPIKKQEEALKQSRKIQQTLLEQIPVAVYVKDAESLRYQIWNKAAEKLFSLKREDVIGNTEEDVFPPGLAKMFSRLNVDTLKKKETVKTDEKTVEMSDGSSKTIIAIQVPVVIDEQVHAILGIAMDMTQSIEVKKQLIEAKNNAEKSDRLKSSHLANMSHEIRNPMNSIVGFSRILVEDENLDAGDKEEFISLINENAKHLLSLISDIIDIAKIENNKLKIFKSSFNFNEQLNKLKSIYIQQLKELNKPQVKIRLETPLSDDKAVIYTDENRFVQIFNNLITNAIKFTKEGEIRIGYEIVSDDKLHFFVKDTGVGIENSQKEQIFEEFHQIGPSGRGKGLGLSISKQLVTYLGGEIWLKSELGKGSAFFFSLPYDFNKQSDTLETAPLKKAVAPETKKNNVDWSDKKVMIVDDAKDVLTFVSILLRKTNVQIDTALTGSEALQKINESDGGYNLILMDIQMPGISGVEALQRIKESYPDMPVFAQTAFALEGDEARFLKKGFDAYIPKPVNRNELLRKMTPFMEH